MGSVANCNRQEVLMRFLKTSAPLLPLAVFMLTAVTPIYADPTLTIDGFMVGGSISYPGGSSPLAGTLGIGAVFTLESNALDCFCGVSFTTGPLTGTDATNWFFGPGGSVSMTGQLFSGVYNPGIPVTTPLTGSFLGTPTLTANLLSSSPDVVGYDFNATILATPDTEVTSLLGLPGGVYDGSFSFVTGSGESLGGAFGLPPGPALGGGIDLVSIKLTPVPEPTSLLLLASVMAAGIGLKIRAGSRPQPADGGKKT